MPTEYNLQMIDDERLALVYNFTPAQSISVVDVEAREFLAEIPTPGCAFVYPMRGRKFATLCGDGTMLRVELDENGQQESAERTEPFFDADDNPVMEKAALIDGYAYFPTFWGEVIPVDLRRDMPRPEEPWSLIGTEEGGWRPGGLQMSGKDSDDHLYVLMHPDGYDGSHKDPGIEVWVFDVDRERRINRIGLQLPAISFAITKDDDPLLVATNINLEIVYDVRSGSHLRTIGNFGQETPFMLYGGM